MERRISPRFSWFIFIFCLINISWIKVEMWSIDVPIRKHFGQPCAWSAQRHSVKKSAQHIHWQIFRLFTPNVHFIRIRMRLSVKISAMSKYSQQKPLTVNSLKGQDWISLFATLISYENRIINGFEVEWKIMRAS